MADRVKVYEETKKKGLSIWAWLLPLLLLLALLIYFLTRHPAAQSAAPAPAPAVAAAPAPAAMPNLGTIHFDTNQATLTPEAQNTLRQAADYMKQNPGAHLRVEGYTDSTGAPAHNASLSDQRAYSVANFLKAQGIEGSRLTGGGFGQAEPVASNATTSGKADNRRVELFSQQ